MANSYLTLSGTAGGSTTKFTKSFWLKRSSLTQGYITDNSGTDEVGMYFNSSDKLICFVWDWSAYSTELITTREFRDTSAWYHIVFAVDYTNSTQAQRARVYVNGEEITSFTTTTRPGNNSTTFDTYNSSKTHYIGRTSGGSHYFDGYISHLVHVDGQQLSPTSFGETDSTSGIWKFKSPSGVSFGTKGYHLKFENSGNLGLDSSGQTNNFTVNGNLKQAVDTQSNVFATWNPLVPTGGGYQSNSSTHRYGNNDFVTNNSSSNYGTTWSTLGMTTGKYYMEVHYESSSNQGIIGIIGHYPSSTANYIGGHANSYGIYTDGNKYNSGSSSSYGTSWTNGDYLGIFLDLDNNKLYFSKNGTVMNSGTGIDITAASLTEMGAYHFACMEYNSSGNGDFGANFGNGSFRTTQLTGTTYDDADGNGIFKYEPTGLTLDSSTKSFKSLSTKGLNS